MSPSNREKKSDRLKRYFAETAKELIIKSGIESVSVRKVASEAGYAYATIYNHFLNLDELLWLTRAIFIEDIFEYMTKNETKKEIDSVDSLVNMFLLYSNYFITNPEVYRFLYFKNLDPKYKTTNNLSESDSFKSNFAKSFSFLLTEKGYSMEKLMLKAKSIIYILNGILTLAISENDELELNDIEKEIKTHITDILIN